MKKFSNTWMVSSIAKRTIGVIILFLCVLHPIIAQKIQTYSGHYKDGDAEYEYYDTEKGRVYHGDFSFSASDKSRAVEINGSFKNNLRDGLWEYTCIIKSADKGRVHKKKFYIEYQNGIRNGKYEYVYKKDDKTVEKLTTTTKNGLIDGAFAYDSFNDYDMTSEIIRGYYVLGCRGGQWISRKYKDSGKSLFITQYFDYKYYTDYYINHETGEKNDGRFLDNMSGQHVKRESMLVESLLSTPYTLNFGSFVAGDLWIIPYDDRFLDNNVSSANNLLGIIYPLKIKIDTTKEELLKQRKLQQKITKPVFDENRMYLDYFLWEQAREAAKRLKVTKKTSRLVNTIIEADGTISHVRIEPNQGQEANKSIIDEEALRIVKSMPQWIPATQNDKNIRCQMTIKVTFLP